MPRYTLIEYKLRRYVYLGHEYSMYVPPSIRNSFWAQKHHDDLIGVRIIGKIIKKNKPEEINSIVPIILKVSKNSSEISFLSRISIVGVCQCTQPKLLKIVKPKTCNQYRVNVYMLILVNVIQC